MSETNPLTLATEAIQALFVPGQVVEVRVLGTRPGKRGTLAAGYYDDFNLLAKAVVDCSERKRNNHVVEGVYYTLNPCLPDLMARYANRIQADAGLTTSDKEVICRKHLLVDCDSVRAAGISSNDEEKHQANERAARVKEFLIAQGWPLPIEADSGNGYHLLYKIDLPNDDASKDLIKSCLVALSARFDDAAVKIDTSVHNAARITKAYGSMARKGDSYGQRVHRRSRMLCNPNAGLVELQLLQSLASEVPTPELTENNDIVAPEKFEEQLDLVGVAHGEAQAYSGGWRWHLDNCAFDPAHVRTAIIVGVRANGALYYKCSHNSCQLYGWKDFRETVEKQSGKRMRFHDPSKPFTPTPDHIVLQNLRNDVRAWTAYEAKLETFALDPQAAYSYLLEALVRCGARESEQINRLFEASPLYPLYQRSIPSHIENC